VCRGLHSGALGILQVAMPAVLVPGDREATLWRVGMSCSPLPAGSLGSSPEVPSQPTDLDLQEIAEVKNCRDTWPGE
jgi:hypothetical protein